MIGRGETVIKIYGRERKFPGILEPVRETEITIKPTRQNTIASIFNARYDGCTIGTIITKDDISPCDEPIFEVFCRGGEDITIGRYYIGDSNTLIEAN